MPNDAPPLTIRVDSREQASPVPAELRRLGVIIDDALLETGDYICAPHVVVERKAASDLVLSVIDRRIFEQTAKMVAEFETSIVLIEGDIYSTGSAISEAALDGVLSWLATLSGVTVMSSHGPAHSARLIATIARHAQQGLGYEIALRANKPKQLKVQQQYLVEGLPGCGGARAKQLLQHFKTPHRLFTASREDLKAIRGVGDKLADAILDVLHGTGH